MFGVLSLAAAVFVFVAVQHHSGPTAASTADAPVAPIAGGTVTASVSPGPTATRRQVTGLTPTRSIGGCFDLHGRAEVHATFVPCGRTHGLQLVGIETATGTDGRFPSQTYWDGPVSKRCLADLIQFTGQPPSRWPPRLSANEFYPRPESWALGNRTVYCAAQDRPRASGSFRHLRPYRRLHAPIADRTTPVNPTPAAGSGTVISGRLGLVRANRQVCLTVTTGGSVVTIEPFGSYSLTWRIVDGTPDAARSGIAVGAHPSSSDIVRHLGAFVDLTGDYVRAMPQACGAIRQFDFSAVH